MIDAVAGDGERPLIALFAAIGSQHICVTPAPRKPTNCAPTSARRPSPPTGRGSSSSSSHLALLRLTDGLDLVFIDGAHGYPTPIVDWVYACSLLARHGIVIVDDTPLPVAALLGFLERDPRWEPVERASAGRVRRPAAARPSRASGISPLCPGHIPGARGSLARRFPPPARVPLRR